MFGADYLVRMKNPTGSFYITVSGRGPEKKPEDRHHLAQGGAAHHPDPGDQGQVPRLRPGEDQGRRRLRGRLPGGRRRCASPPWRWPRRSRSPAISPAPITSRPPRTRSLILEKNNLSFANDGKENIVDDYCALTAAVELFRATKKPVYKDAADKRAANLMARLTTSGNVQGLLAGRRQRPSVLPSRRRRDARREPGRLFRDRRRRDAEARSGTPLRGPWLSSLA